jgi:hypothetical protein
MFDEKRKGDVARKGAHFARRCGLFQASEKRSDANLVEVPILAKSSPHVDVHTSESKISITTSELSALILVL